MSSQTQEPTVKTNDRDQNSLKTAGPNPDNDEQSDIAKETLAIDIENEYDRLRDRALSAWSEIKLYVGMRGSAILDRCHFGHFMSFCEDVADLPHQVDVATNDLMFLDHADDYDVVDPY